MSNQSTSNTDLNVPPEEEELFKEFQSYVRSIYIAASGEAIKSITDATQQLRNDVRKLSETVQESRESYLEMFAPALANFVESSENTLIKLSKQQDEVANLRMQSWHAEYQRLAKQQDEIAALHWGKAVDLLKQQSAKQDELNVIQVTRATDLLTRQSQEFTKLIGNQKNQYEMYLSEKNRRLILLNLVYYVSISLIVPVIYYFIFRHR
jgi:hypothetical protein